MSLPVNQSDNRYATDSIALLQINFATGYRRYADRDFYGWSGKILSLSPLRSQKTADNVAMVSSCTVELDDSNGAFKSLFESELIEGMYADIYQVYAEQGNNPTRLFRGKINAPIEWSENQTAKFDIVTDLQARQLGYTAYDTRFLDTNNEHIGKVWPLVFGSCAGVKSPLVQSVPRGKLLGDLGITNMELYQLSEDDEIEWNRVLNIQNLKQFIGADLEPALLENARHITIEKGELFPSGVILIEIDGVILKVQKISTNIFFIHSVEPKYENIQLAARHDLFSDEDDVNNPKLLWLKESDRDKLIAGHMCYFARQDGTFFENMCVSQVGRACYFKYPFKKDEIPGATAHPAYPVWGLLGPGCSIASVYKYGKYGLKFEIEQFIKEYSKRASARRRHDSENKAVGAMLRELDLISYVKSCFWSAKKGTSVKQWNSAIQDKYVANSLPSTEVLSVYAKNSNDELICIPENFYTVNLAETTTVVDEPTATVVTTISFQHPIDSYDGHELNAENVYVTLRSTIGNNTADILAWLINNFTNSIADSTFTTLRTVLAGYPSDFVINWSSNAIETINQIAFLARCAIVWGPGTASLVYLSPVPEDVMTLDETNCHFKSLSLSYTETEDIITELIQKYRITFVEDEFPYFAGWKNNIDLFGYKSKTIDNFIYQDTALVGLSSRFWVNRFCQSFKVIRVKAFSEARCLQVFDCIKLTFNHATIGTSVDKAIVTKVEYSIQENSVDLELLVPCVAGTNTQYTYFWWSETEITYSDPVNNDIKWDSFYSKKDYLDFDDVVREIQKYANFSYRLAKIKSFTGGGQILVDFYDNGPFESATEANQFCHDIVPANDFKIGSWIWVKGTNDGVTYAVPAQLPEYYAIIRAHGTNIGANYPVELVDFDTFPSPAEPGEGLPTWAKSFNIDKEGDAQHVYLSACNLSEMIYTSENTGTVPAGTVVKIRYIAPITGEGFWAFEYQVPDLGQMLPDGGSKYMALTKASDDDQDVKWDWIRYG